MDRYQYKIVNLGMFNSADRMVRVFHVLGSDGWELVSMYDKASNWFSNMEKGFAIFKRTVPAGHEPDGEWATWSYSFEFQLPGETAVKDNPYDDPEYGAW